MCDALEQGCTHLQLLAKPSLSELAADTNYARGALSAAATRLLAALRRVVPRAKDEEEREDWVEAIQAALASMELNPNHRVI